MAIFFSQFNHIGGNIQLVYNLALIIPVIIGLHFYQVNYSLKALLFAYGKLNSYRISMQTLLHHI